MRSIDWPSIWDQRGPLEPSPALLDLAPMCEKHRLKILKKTNFQHLLLFGCQDCNWMLACRRILVHHMVMGNVGWVSGNNPEGDVVYRGWFNEGGLQHVIPRDTQDAARITPGCGDRSD